MTLKCTNCKELIKDEIEASHHVRYSCSNASFIREFEGSEKWSDSRIEMYRESDWLNWNGKGKDAQFQHVIETYSLFLDEGDYEKYQPMVYSHTEQEKLDALIEAEILMMKGLWIKNRFTKYYSEPWGYLSTLFHKEWFNLELLLQIKNKYRPYQDIDTVFLFSNHIRTDHTT